MIVNLDEQLNTLANETDPVSVNEKALSHTIRVSKAAFWKGEAEQDVTWWEFLYQQSFYVKKIWWLLQAGVLLFLWLFLKLSEGDYYTGRCMGVLSPVFVILILPELWKNDTSRSLEVESAALFSLRKIVAARMVLFGMVDLVLLTVFLTVSTVSLGLSSMELIVEFLLPMLVTCCICFHMFGSHRGIAPSLFACLFWLSVWTLVVLREDVYCAVSTPVWIGAVVLSILYLCYCVARMWRDAEYYYQYNL